MKNFLSDQQFGILALLIICALTVGARIEGAKDILLTLGGAIAGWMSKTNSG